MPGAATSASPHANTPVPAAKKKNNKAKAALIGVGIVVVGVCGYYFLWPLIKRKNSSAPVSPTPQTNTNTNSSSGSSTTTHSSPAPGPTPPKPATPVRNDNFPLKQGSKGPNVTMLQNALMAKYGASILKDYGADGIFGDEVAKALKSKNLPASVDQTTFITLTEGTKIDPKKLAADIVAATLLGFSKVAPLLDKIKTAQDYKAVSDEFKTYRVGFVHYASLLTAMFDIYTNDSEQKQLRQKFTNMGLVYQPDADTWKLPENLSGFSLVTTQITHVWPDAKTAIQVPPNMVLGQEISRQGDFITFENQGRKFLVPTAHVRYA